MISTTELRIGNLISFTAFTTMGQPTIKSDKVDGIVKQIDGVARVYVGGLWLSEEHINGLLLTAELLTKCGFAHYGSGGAQEGKLMYNYYALVSHDLFFSAEINPAGAINELSVSANSDCRIIKPKKYRFLHNLQNLHYELTGEEMTA